MRRILFVSRHYASDFSVKVGGVFQRMRMLLDAAARSADALDILFFVDSDIIDKAGPMVAQHSLERDWNLSTHVRLAPRAAMPHGPLLQTLQAVIEFRAQEDYFRFNGPTQFAAARASVAGTTDLIVAHRLYAGSTVVGSAITGVPVVMDLDDIEHLSRARQLRRSMPRLSSSIKALELRALKRGELATLAACATSLVCSRVDQEYLASLGAPNTTVIPNAIQFPPLRTTMLAEGETMTMFFIGTYGYPPNADAAEYLINRVFPRVRRRRPEARLVIAGEAPEKLPSHALSPPGVTFTGFVQSLEAVYRSATVVCCPIHAGGGTRIKIIEAAAFGKAIVSTTLGAEGLALEDGREILLRDTPEAFADACLQLFDDPERRAALGAAAYTKARSLYDRPGVVERIARTFIDCARPLYS